MSDRLRDRLRDRVHDVGAGAADTFAVCCVLGVVGGSVGLLILTTPVWAPMFFFARAGEHANQRLHPHSYEY